MIQSLIWTPDALSPGSPKIPPAVLDAVRQWVARGGHLVEADLLAALNADRLGGAALDVFDAEPLPEDHPFWGHPKIVVTPHIAAFSVPETAVESVIANIERNSVVWSSTILGRNNKFGPIISCDQIPDHGEFFLHRPVYPEHQSAYQKTEISEIALVKGLMRIAQLFG